MSSAELFSDTRKGMIDIPTSIVILAMIFGFPLIASLQSMQVLHPLISIFLGSILMNFSFTAWHEPAHGNFSKYKSVNHIAGYLASLASVYPGYFARRREHLAHHKWEGIEGKDPVYARVQANSWYFPLHLLYVNFVKRNPVDIPDSFCRYTTAQRIADRASDFTALAVVVTAGYFGYFPEILCVWIAPRLLILFLHAYFICFFPHRVRGGGYEIFRVRESGPLVRFITLEQNYHGIHHKWPFLPWYRYATLIKSDLFSNSGIVTTR